MKLFFLKQNVVLLFYSRFFILISNANQLIFIAFDWNITEHVSFLTLQMKVFLLLLRL